jgi:hypothetical protein
MAQFSARSVNNNNNNNNNNNSAKFLWFNAVMQKDVNPEQGVVNIVFTERYGSSMRA